MQADDGTAIEREEGASKGRYFVRGPHGDVAELTYTLSLHDALPI